MVFTFIGIAEKVLSLVIWVKDFFVHKSAVNEGRQDQKLADDNQVIKEQAKELSDVEKEQAFEDRLIASPKFCDRVRSSTNATISGGD